MVDEMKLRIGTIFMRELVAKMVKKAVCKKLGYDVDLVINKLNIEVADGKAHLQADIDATTDSEHVMNLLKNLA